MQLSQGMFIVIALLGVLNWVGPLRSDYTRQLIRSRFHAGRILLMYGVVFPFLIIFAVGILIEGP